MTPGELADLVVKMAVENPRWGYTRIRGALANLGHEIARNTASLQAWHQSLTDTSSPPQAGLGQVRLG